MTIEEIKKIIEANKDSKKVFKITFKKRDALYGYFVECNDAASLHSKNFWRIVTNSHLSEWVKTRDLNLSRLFHGGDFSKISVEK